MQVAVVNSNVGVTRAPAQRKAPGSVVKETGEEVKGERTNAPVQQIVLSVGDCGGWVFQIFLK